MSESKPHSEPCPVCLRDDAWDLEYDFGTGDEVEVTRCQNCGWPPTYPATVEEHRRKHFVSPYLKDLEAMVADRDARITGLVEQFETLNSAALAIVRTREALGSYEMHIPDYLALREAASGERVAAGLPSSTSETSGANQSPEESSPASEPEAS